MQSTPSHPAVKFALSRAFVFAGLFVWLASTPILFLLYRTLEPSPDQSIFDYIAWLATEGVTPYAGSFEVNWPGSILIHIAAQKVFGPYDNAIRSFDFFIMQGTAIACAIMLWRNQMRVAASLLLAFYPPLYITAGVWVIGERDIIATELLVIASVLLANPRRAMAGLILAGVLCAFAFLIRPTYLAFLAGITLLELIWPGSEERGGRWRSIGAILLGAILLFLSMIVLGIGTGSLNAWYEASIHYALDCYGAQRPPLSMIGTPVDLLTKSWPWISVFAMGGAICWALRGDVRRFPLMLCLGIMATCVLSYVVQRKGFSYHLGGLLIIFVLLLSIFADTLFKAAEGGLAHDRGLFASTMIPRPLWWIGVFGLLLICVAGIIVKLSNSVYLASGSPILLTMKDPAPSEQCESFAVAHSAAAFIAKDVHKGAYILPINCGYRAAFLARRLPTSRFATSTSFGGNNMQCAIGGRLMQDYMNDISARPPAIILGSSKNFDATSRFISARAGSPESIKRATAMASDYRRVAQFGDLILFAPARRGS